MVKHCMESLEQGTTDGTKHQELIQKQNQKRLQGWWHGFLECLRLVLHNFPFLCAKILARGKRDCQLTGKTSGKMEIDCVFRFSGRFAKISQRPLGEAVHVRVPWYEGLFVRVEFLIKKGWTLCSSSLAYLTRADWRLFMHRYTVAKTKWSHTVWEFCHGKKHLYLAWMYEEENDDEMHVLSQELARSIGMESTDLMGHDDCNWCVLLIRPLSVRGDTYTQRRYIHTTWLRLPLVLLHFFPTIVPWSHGHFSFSHARHGENDHVELYYVGLWALLVYGFAELFESTIGQA